MMRTRLLFWLDPLYSSVPSISSEQEITAFSAEIQLSPQSPTYTSLRLTTNPNKQQDTKIFESA